MWSLQSQKTLNNDQEGVMLAKKSMSRNVLTVSLAAVMAIGLCSSLVGSAQAGGRGGVHHGGFHGHAGYRHVEFRGHRGYYGHRHYGYGRYYGYAPVNGYVATDYVPAPIPTYSTGYCSSPAPVYEAAPTYVQPVQPAPSYQTAPVYQQTAGTQPAPNYQQAPGNDQEPEIADGN